MKTKFQKSSHVRTWSTRYGNKSYSNRRASERPDGHSIVYVSVDGESVIENLVNRRSRPYKALRPIVLEELKKHGIPFKNIRWSQRAGCSCPCSPGFIIQGGDIGQDYWLTIMDDE